MTAQVRPTTTKALLSKKSSQAGDKGTNGERTTLTKYTVKHTPNQVTDAIFQRGGACAVRVPSGVNQARRRT